MNDIFKFLAPPLALHGLPPPWRFVSADSIVRHFGVSKRTLASWRNRFCSPRWAYDDVSETFWYQPGVLLIWGHRFTVSESGVLSDWFEENLKLPGATLAERVKMFERAIPDAAPTFLRFPSMHSSFFETDLLVSAIPLAAGAGTSI